MQPPGSKKPLKGRGAVSNPGSRFDQIQREDFDDGWDSMDEEPAARPRTELIADAARSIISYNDSPDIPFDRSINPYKGCEHGCIYCYARPTHAYLGLSPGLDFETKILHKPNAAALLREELSRPGYRPRPIALGTATDPYQPIERRLRITRQILELLYECRHPVAIITKGGAIERDLDILAPMAERNLVSVAVSVTTLRSELSRRLEPRAAAPQRRLRAIEALSKAGVPVTVLVAPLIPALNDNELEAILEAVRAAGARSADYVMLRLPHEVKQLFKEWLAVHEPLKAEHVMSLVRQIRGGRENETEFGRRMRGGGIFAQLINKRFHLAARRLGLGERGLDLDCRQFRPPSRGGQLPLL